MKLIRIGNTVMNMDQATRIAITKDTVTVYFGSGSDGAFPDSHRFTAKGDCDALKLWLEKNCDDIRVEREEIP